VIRRILILLVLVAALGTYLYVYELPEAAREGKKAKLLGVDKDAITGVVLTYPDRELELKKDDQGWRLVRPAEAPADDTVVKGVLSTLTDAEVQKTLGELPPNLADFGLDKPTVTVKLTLKDGSQPPPLVVGKNTTSRSSISPPRRSATASTSRRRTCATNPCWPSRTTT